MGVTINCDMGESYGLYKMGDDESLMNFVTVANVACGYHASDPNHMRATVRMAKTHGVKVGAHPSFPDLQGFGRREMQIDREELANIIIYQVGALAAFLKAEDMELNHIKPHGSLYMMATRDEAIANAVCDAADVFSVPLFGMVNTMQAKVYQQRKHKFVSEYYADLFYDDAGSVILTREHTAVDPGEAAKRAVHAIDNGITRSVGGTDVTVRADSICVHSDTPNAVELAQAVRKAVAPYM